MADHLINVRVKARLEAAGLSDVVNQAQAALARLRGTAQQALAQPAGSAGRAAGAGQVRQEFLNLRQEIERGLQAARLGDLAGMADNDFRKLRDAISTQLNRIAQSYTTAFGNDPTTGQPILGYQTQGDIRHQMGSRGVAEAAGGIREEEDVAEAARARADAMMRETGILEAGRTIERDLVEATAILGEERRRMALEVAREYRSSRTYVQTLANLRAANARLEASVREAANRIPEYLQGRAQQRRAGQVERASTAEMLAQDPTSVNARARIIVADRHGRAVALAAASSMGLAQAQVAATTATNNARAAAAALGATTPALIQSEVALQTANQRKAAATNTAAAADADLGRATTEAARATRTRRIRRITTEGADPQLQRLSAAERLAKLQNINNERERLLANDQYTEELKRTARLAEQERVLRQQAVAEVRAELAASRGGGPVQQGPVSGFQRLMATMSQRGVGPHAVGPGGGGAESFEALAARMPRLGQFIGQRALTTVGFAATGLAFRAVTTGLVNVIQQAEALQRQFSLIEAQFESIGQAGQFADFRRGLLQIARDSGQAAEEVAWVGFQIKGVYGEDTQRAVRETEAAIRAAVVTGLQQKEIVDSLTAASLAFRNPTTGEAGISIDDITDKAIGLEERFGVLSQESIKFFGDIADTATAAGLNLDELGQIAGVVQQKLAVGGAALAENVGRILGSMQENSVKVLEIFTRFPELAASLPDVQRQIGTGQTGPVLMQLAKNWDQLSAAEQKSIAVAIGGQRQYRTITATLGGLNQQIREGALRWDEQSQSFVDATNDHGKAVARQRALNETLAVQLNRLREVAKQFGDALFEAGLGDFLVMLVSSGRQLLEALGAVLRVVGEINQAFGGMPGKILLIALAMRGVLATWRAIRGFSLGGMFGGMMGARAAAGGLTNLAAPTAVGQMGLRTYLSAASQVGAAGYGERGGLMRGLRAGGWGGLGAAAGASLSSALPVVGLLAVGMISSYVSSRRQQEADWTQEFQRLLSTGDEKDRREVERLADQRETYGDRLRGALSWSGLGAAWQNFGSRMTGGLIPESSFQPQTEQQLAREAIERQGRIDRGVGHRSMLEAYGRVGVPRTGGPLSGLFEGLPQQLQPTAPLLNLQAELEERKAYTKDTQKFLDDLQAGDEEAFNLAEEMLRDMFGDERITPEVGQRLADTRRQIETQIKLVASDGQTALNTVALAQQAYNLGKIRIAELLNIEAVNLASLNAAIEAAGGEQNADEMLVAARNTLEQQHRDTLHKQVEEITSGRLRDIAGRGDPQATANTALANARTELDFLRRNGGTQIEINNAEAAVNEALDGVRRADNDVTLARLREARRKIGLGENALEDARLQQNLAQNAINNARGVAERLDAEAQKAEADKAVTDALFKIDQSRLALLQATASAAGNDIRAAELAHQQVQAELKKALATPGTGQEVINGLKAQAAASQDQLSATRVSETRELIDFRLEMEEITVGQAIGQLQALLQSPDVQSNKNRVMEIRRAIKALQKQVQGQLEFNIGDLRLPTYYETRRLGESAAMGMGYNDNRQVVVTMNNYNSTDYQGSIDQFVGLVNQPSRYGTYASIYPTRN